MNDRTDKSHAVRCLPLFGILIRIFQRTDPIEGSIDNRTFSIEVFRPDFINPPTGANPAGKMAGVGMLRGRPSPRFPRLLLTTRQGVPSGERCVLQVDLSDWQEARAEREHVHDFVSDGYWPAGKVFSHSGERSSGGLHARDFACFQAVTHGKSGQRIRRSSRKKHHALPRPANARAVWIWGAIAGALWRQTVAVVEDEISQD